MKSSKLIIITLFVAVVVPTILKAENAQPGAATELPTVIVTSEPLQPSLLEYSSPASKVTEAELQNQRFGNIGDSVALEPGVSSSSFGPGVSRPVIRGFSGERVRVLKNGVATGDVSSISEDHIVTTDPFQSEAIEILRGPETLLYGSNGIGGIVNSIDTTIPERPIGKEVSGQILMQAGNSADEERSGAIKLRGQFGKINWNANTFYRDTDDISIPGMAESDILKESELAASADHNDHEEDGEHDEHAEEEDNINGRLLNSESLTKGASLGASYIGAEGFLGVSITGFSSDYGIPGHSHEHHVEDEHIELDDEHDDHDGDHIEEMTEHSEEESVKIQADEFRVDLKGGLDLTASSINRIKFALGVFDYQHKELEGGQEATKFQNQGLEARAEGLYDITDSFSGVAGLNIKYAEFSVSGEEAYITPTDTLQPGIFSYNQLDLSKKLKFDLGARFEVVEHSPEEGNNESYFPISIAAGPVIKLNDANDYALGISLAYSERAPAPSELFSNGAHLARQIFEVGNVDLEKESAIGADLTIRKNTGILTGSATSFIQDFSDYINLSATGAEEDGLPVYSYQATSALFWGFELESTLALHKVANLGSNQLYLDFQLDHVRARDTDSDINLPRIQPLRTIGRLRYVNDYFSGYLESVNVQSQSDTAPLELRTGAYNILNSNLSVPVHKKDNKLIELFLNATNLTDEEVRLHTSFLKDIAPQRGRALLLGIKGSF